MTHTRDYKFSITFYRKHGNKRVIVTRIGSCGNAPTMPIAFDIMFDYVTIAAKHLNLCDGFGYALKLLLCSKHPDLLNSISCNEEIEVSGVDNLFVHVNMESTSRIRVGS